MSATWNDIAFAARLRDLIRRVVRAEVRTLRPPHRYGTVGTITPANMEAEVTFEGDDAPVLVRFGQTTQPSEPGQLVRVGGTINDRYISEIITAPQATPGPPGSGMFFNVKNYGALADDATNDGPAFQAAVDAAFAAGGGTVFVPAGTYKLTTPVVITRNTDGRFPVAIIGEGTASVLHASTGISMIRVENTGDPLFQTTMPVIESLKFNMDHASAIALDLNQCSYGHFDDLEFAGVGTGIVIDGGSAAIANQFSRLRFVFPGVAIHIVDGAYNIFTNVVVLEGISGARAIWVQGGAGNIIDGFTVRGNQLGVGGPTPVGAIHIGAAESTVLANGLIFDAAAVGLLIDGSPNFTSVQNVVVKDSQQHGAKINGNRGQYDLSIFDASLDGLGLFDGLRVTDSATGNTFKVTVAGTNHAEDIRETHTNNANNSYLVGNAVNGITLLSGSSTLMGAGHLRIKNSQWTSGAGSPEGVVTAAVGSLHTRTDGGALTTLYVKETGTGNTGWVAK